MTDKVIVPGFWQGVRPLLYGEEACLPGHRYGPHIRPYYLLHYVFRGRGYLQYADRQIPLGAGDMFVIHPGEVTTYFADDDDPWAYGWLGISSEQPLPFLEPHVLRRAPGRYLFENLRAVSDKPEADARVFSITFELLGLLSAAADAGSGPPAYAPYVKTYLEANYMQPIRLQALAAELHIDRRYLHQVFTAAYGVSPQAFLMETRLRKARELLHKGYTVTEAAHFAGFSDLSNFSRHYKKFFGRNPGQEGKRPAP